MRLLVPWKPLLSSQPGTCPTLSHRLSSFLYLFLQWSSTSGYLENSGWPTCEGMQLLLVVSSFPKSDSWLRDDSSDNQATCVIFPWLQPIFCLCFLLTVNFSPKSEIFLLLPNAKRSFLYLPNEAWLHSSLFSFLPLISSWICSVIKNFLRQFQPIETWLPWGPLLSSVTSSVCQRHLEYWLSSKVSGVTGYTLVCCL